MVITLFESELSKVAIIFLAGTIQRSERKRPQCKLVSLCDDTFNHVVKLAGSGDREGWSIRSHKAGDHGMESTGPKDLLGCLAILPAT